MGGWILFILIILTIAYRAMVNPAKYVPVGVILCILALIFYFYGAQLGVLGFLVEHSLPGLISEESWKRVVANPDSGDAYSAYSVLGMRKSRVAVEIAREQLHSDDDYLWLNAAHYLGDVGEKKAIPYLIKSLRHTAWRSDEDRRQLLIDLTGQDFGTDFDKWQQWWLTHHPQETIDWESDLGRAPRVRRDPVQRKANRLL